MKKILLFSAAMAIGFSGMAQKNKVSAARDYYAEDALLRARTTIDEAVVHPETKESAEAWLMRANIYVKIVSSAAVSPSVPDALEQTRASIVKAIQLNPKYDKEGVDYVIESAISSMMNKGIGELQNKKFDSALISFSGIRTFIAEVGGINRFSNNSERQSKIAKISRNSKQFAAYCNIMKEEKDYPSAITLLEELRKIKTLDAKNAQDIYTYLIYAYQGTDNTAKYEEVVKEASTKFPDNTLFQNMQLNVAIKNGETANIISTLESNPKLSTDPELLYALANTYHRLADIESQSANADTLALAEKHRDKAEAGYRKGMGLKDAARFNLGLGLIYYNRVQAILLQMTSLGSTPADNQKYDDFQTQSKKLMNDAVPFFEKAATQYEVIGLANLKKAEYDSERKAYKNTLIALRDMYGRLENNTKRIETNKKIDAIGG